MNHFSATSPPNDQRKSPGGEDRQGFQQRLPIDARKSSKHPPKWQRILAAFVDGASLNMFEGERIGDHALHSTVSGLQARGLILHRREERVAGYQGQPTLVKRYWLSGESRGRALELLGRAQPTNT
jgi:hypothetical protein